MLFLTLSIQITSIGIVNIVFNIFNNRKRLVRSPYDGNTIIINEETEELKIKKVINALNKQFTKDEINQYYDKLKEDEKRNYLLMSAIISNPFYNDEDLKNIEGYLNYLNDNPYIDYETIYKLLKSSIIKESKKIDGASAMYYSDKNLILYSDSSSILHEIFHLENKYLMLHEYDEDFQDWFNEASSEVLAGEYQNNKSYTYSCECAALRLVTNLIGSDCILKARSIGDFSVITNNLINKGAKEDTINKTFELLNQHVTLTKKIGYSNNQEEKDEIKDVQKELRKSISDNIVKMYLEINGYDTKYVNPLFLRELNDLIFENKVDYFDFSVYLFNREQKDINGEYLAIENCCYQDIEHNGVILHKYPCQKYYNNDSYIMLYEINDNLYKKEYKNEIDALYNYKKENLSRVFDNVDEYTVLIKTPN